MSHKKSRRRKSEYSDLLGDVMDVTKVAIGAEVSLAALGAVSNSIHY